MKFGVQTKEKRNGRKGLRNWARARTPNTQVRKRIADGMGGIVLVWRDAHFADLGVAIGRSGTFVYATDHTMAIAPKMTAEEEEEERKEKDATQMVMTYLQRRAVGPSSSVWTLNVNDEQHGNNERAVSGHA